MITTWNLARQVSLFCLASALPAVCVCAAGSVDPARACTTEQLQARVSAPIQIESAAPVAAQPNVPAHCAVVGAVEHGSRIRFGLALPETWNGKFLFFGIGGFAGVLAPLGPGIAKGYATATTDTGHQAASVEDAAWALNNPAGVINHYESGVELAARAAKSLIAAYYGTVPAHSYFQGCSAGGRQALIEAQRFPSSFDGVVAEAPAWNYSALLMSFAEYGKIILGSADNWVPPEMFAEIDRVVLEQCDALDGVADGIVTDPRRCKPDLRRLACHGPKPTRACLTSAQIRTLEKLQRSAFGARRPGYFGFRLTGSERSPGYSWGWSEWFFGTLPPVADAHGKLNFRGDVLPAGEARGHGPNQFLLGEQFFRYMVMNDAGFDARSFSIERDGPRLQRALGDILDADDTNLAPFLRSGGKLLIWHGWSDPAIPPEMSIDLYERIRRDTTSRPGQPSVDDAVRLFMMPGVQHCGGGTGLTFFDALGAMEQWVEHGHAPEQIVASQIVDAKVARSRPVCAYPKSAHYRGTGDSNVADTFECR